MPECIADKMPNRLQDRLPEYMSASKAGRRKTLLMPLPGNTKALAKYAGSKSFWEHFRFAGGARGDQTPERETKSDPKLEADDLANKRQMMI